LSSSFFVSQSSIHCRNPLYLRQDSARLILYLADGAPLPKRNGDSVKSLSLNFSPKHPRQVVETQRSYHPPSNPPYLPSPHTFPPFPPAPLRSSPSLVPGSLALVVFVALTWSFSAVSSLSFSRSSDPCCVSLYLSLSLSRLVFPQQLAELFPLPPFSSSFVFPFPRYQREHLIFPVNCLFLLASHSVLRHICAPFLPPGTSRPPPPSLVSFYFLFSSCAPPELDGLVFCIFTCQSGILH